MKTLDYIKLNESGVNNVVASLQQLLAEKERTIQILLNQNK